MSRSSSSTLAAASIGAVVALLTPRALADLRCGIDAEGGAPYAFRAPSAPERLEGFEVDIAAALGRVVGERIALVQYDFGSLLPGLERGDLDAAMNGIEVTPDRRARVPFTRPYYTYRLQLVTRAADQRFDTVEGCVALGCAVGTLGETAAERLLDARGARKRIYEGQVEPYRDLALGRTDAVLLDRPIALYYAERDAALRFAGAPFAPGAYAIAVRPDRPDLAERLDRGLASLFASGELQKILERWRLWDDAQTAAPHATAQNTTAQSATAPEATVRSADPSEAALERWSPRRYLPLLLEGLATTTVISIVSMGLAVVLALPIALARLYGPAPARALAVVYVELFRGVPVLLVLFFLYYGLPTVGLRLGPLSAAVIGFSLNYAAYEAEVYRAAIGGVAMGQWEAAASLGMSPALTLRRIVLPQAFRLALPPMTNDFVALFKDTSLVSVIAVVELTKQYQMIARSSLQYLEVGGATAALYLAVSLPLAALSRALERRFSRGAS